MGAEASPWEASLRLDRAEDAARRKALLETIPSGPETLLSALAAGPFPSSGILVWEGILRADDPSLLGALMSDPRGGSFRRWLLERDNPLGSIAEDLAGHRSFLTLRSHWGSLPSRARALAAAKALGAFSAGRLSLDSLEKEPQKSSAASWIFAQAQAQGFWASSPGLSEKQASEISRGVAAALAAGRPFAEEASRALSALCSAHPDLFAKEASLVWQSLPRADARSARHLVDPEKIAAVSALAAAMAHPAAAEIDSCLREAGLHSSGKASPLWALALSMPSERFSALALGAPGALSPELFPHVAFPPGKKTPYDEIARAAENCERAGKLLPQALIGASERAQAFASDAYRSFPSVAARVRYPLAQCLERASRGEIPDPADLEALREACRPEPVSPLFVWSRSHSARRSAIGALAVAKNSLALGIDISRDIAKALPLASDPQERSALEALGISLMPAMAAEPSSSAPRRRL